MTEDHQDWIEVPDRSTSEENVKRTVKIPKHLEEGILQHAEEQDIYYADNPNFSEAARDLIEQALDENS